MQRPLILGPALRPTCLILQAIPLPGVGAIIAGAKNPHSGLLGRGIAQVALVVFGSYPLIIPGAFGLVWAIVDLVRMAKGSVPDVAWSHPTPDADPTTVQPTKAELAQARREKKAARTAQRNAAREERRARREAQKGPPRP